ncbi:cytochrome P450 [Propionibacteriaceae bacterium G1746]
MTGHIPEDVSPDGRDLREFTDELRRDHAVVKNARGEWVFLKHEDVSAIALDDERFSSAVSRFLQVPNGLDGDEHTAFRAALDPFLSAESLAPFEPTFADIATNLVATLPRGEAVDAVDTIGARFAVRAQSAWLGWGPELEQTLVEWVQSNHEASRSGDGTHLAEVAEQFDALIRGVVDARRSSHGGVTGDDVTSDLMRTQVSRDGVHGRALSDEELVSVLRNWTGGDLGSIALCVGVIAHHLAGDATLQNRVRSGVSDAELDAMIDEMLRIDDPFVTNRRITTCPVTIGGVDLPEGARVKLNWTSANRDETVFGDPDVFDPVGNAHRNLVYGLGRHACPGRLLSTIELRVATRALVNGTTSITLAEVSGEREVHPVGGWADAPVILN